MKYLTVISCHHKVNKSLYKVTHPSGELLLLVASRLGPLGRIKGSLVLSNIEASLASVSQ
jgi:hypothetical protein